LHRHRTTVPRRQPVDQQICHVFNRSAAKLRLFHSVHDYRAFLALLQQSKAKLQGAIRIHGYCVMPNHWHLIICAQSTKHLSKFMHRVCSLHARGYLADHPERSGAIYQGRFKAVPVQPGLHLRRLLLYVDRNPLRAGKVRRVEDWLWSSAVHHGGLENDALIDDLPDWPIRDWLTDANALDASDDVTRIALATGRPVGDAAWINGLSAEWNAGTKPRGRPRKLSRAQFT
jgi:putative transposase